MPARVCGQARLVKHFEMHVCTYSVCNVGVSPYEWLHMGFFSVHLADGGLCSSLLFFDGPLSLCFYCLCRPEGQQVLLHRSYWDLVSTK